ncbi:RHS repeat-associated protein [Pseudomonas grimontii]|nr:RHS repeat-associated protein [Pseudomonas grimontii]
MISDFERDRLHREVLRTQGQPTQLPAAQQKHFDYDPADNLIGRLERDRDNRRDQRQLLHYDATGRIIASQDNIQGQRETFAYDAAANLLDGPQANAGLVVHNKLLTYQDKRYRYDGFGRMIEKRSAARGVQYFAYDAEHRLIEVRSQKDGRETVVNMTYDPLGRRIAKTEHDSNGYPLGETRFEWEGLRLLQEHRHSQTSLYIYEEDGYVPLARVDGAGEHQSVRYYHNDLNGLAEQLTEADGHTVWHATYRVWGSTLEEVREPYYIEEQNLRFQGQYLDRETGLHYNLFRHYDPEIGRFTTPDPIDLEGGLNLYQYSPNPLTWIDPWGLKTCYHKRTKSEIKKIRANFGKKGGAKEKYLKKMAKDPSSIQKYGQAGVDRMKKGQVPEGFDVHHKKPIFRGGNNRQSSCLPIPQKMDTQPSRRAHSSYRPASLRDGTAITD